MGYCPFWVLCRDREILLRQGFSSLVLRPGPRPLTRHGLSMCNGCAHMEGHSRDNSPMRTTEPLGSMSQHGLPVSRQGS